MLLTEKTVGIRICTSCTLNCELCAAHVPVYKERGVHYFVSPESYRRELRELFKVYQRIGIVSITGGEPLLHRQLAKLVSITLSEHSAQFDQVRITTNGTLLPGEELLQAIHDYANGNVSFVIDDYGEVSTRVRQIEELLEANHIPYKTNCYCGKEQHCGGWVDLGSLEQRRPYSSEEAQLLLSRCHFGQWKCLDCFEGKLYLCSHASCGHYFHFFETAPGEYIDLFDDSQPLEEKQKTAAEFGKKVISACYHCNGFDTERSPRFPAGVQIGGN